MREDSKDRGLFIKKFRTDKNYYIYSVVQNEISAVDKRVWNVIDKYSPDCEKNGNRGEVEAYIEKFVESGFWSYKRPAIETNLKNIDELKFIFEKSGMQQLILNLTNQCNMRCRYCTFSGNYENERVHEDKHMIRETAFKAVDYFFSKECSEDKRAVTFYGGEVLTRFKLLKEVVDYVKSIDKSVDISFTTNGTLLTSELSEFLIKNGVALNVSLDGDSDLHDKNRLMRGGFGSFHLVMENLKKIKEMSPEFFKKKVSYLAVLTPPYQFEMVKDFFYRSDFFELKKSIMVSPVYLHGTSQYSEEDLPEIYKQFEDAIKRMLKGYEDALIKGDPESCLIEKKWFEELVTSIHFRMKSPVEDFQSPLGQCIPGLRRLFVSTGGKYYMCERVGEHLSIGDVDRGLDIEVVAKFFRDWENYFKDCGSCWAVRLCKKCFTEFNTSGEFDESRREKYCASALKHYEMLLESYCRVLESNSEAFSSFKPENYI